MKCSKCNRPIRGRYWRWAGLEDRFAAFCGDTTIDSTISR